MSRPPLDVRKAGRRSRKAEDHGVDPVRARQMYAKGMSDLAIAAVLRVAKEDVYRWRTGEGLPSNQKRLEDYDER